MSLNMIYLKAHKKFLAIKHETAKTSKYFQHLAKTFPFMSLCPNSG